MDGDSTNNISKQLWQKRRTFALGVTLIIVLLLLLLFFSKMYFTSPKNTLPESYITRLTAIAKAYLTAKNQVLVEGESATVLPQDALTPSYQWIFQGSTERLLRRHKGMMDESTPFTNFTTEVKAGKVEMKQETIILEVTEYTKLYLGGDDPLTPEYTKSHIKHILTFILNDDRQWILVKDDVPMEPGLSEPEAKGDSVIQF